MRVVGMLSGTSYDAIDVAAAELHLDDGELRMEPLGALELPYEPSLCAELADVLPPGTADLHRVCRLDTLLGQEFAAAASRGVEVLCGGQADLVVSHGQTVFHWVESDRARGTLQLGQPAWIAERTGLPVVSGLRTRDIARGGQGAPLVSLLDRLLLPPQRTPRAALNLGGVANMTVVRPDGRVLAYDLGPANALIDATARALFDRPRDDDGMRAARGRVHSDLLAALLDDPYFTASPPKSTGKEKFHWEYVRTRTAAFSCIPADDVLATVTELTARVIADECERYGVTELLVSGGGTHNPTLMARIAALAGGGTQLRPIDGFGLPADAKEAYAFAVLGFLTVHGLPGSLPECTGARAPAVLGSITPGMAPLSLPHPTAVTPDRIRVTRTLTHTSGR